MGITYTVEFEYRDLMAWIRRIAKDKTLRPYLTWYSVKKTLHTHDGLVEVLLDEPETARAWAEVDVRRATGNEAALTYVFLG